MWILLPPLVNSVKVRHEPLKAVVRMQSRCGCSRPPLQHFGDKMCVFCQVWSRLRPLREQMCVRVHSHVETKTHRRTLLDIFLFTASSCL